jgi:hypothetical protein
MLGEYCKSGVIVKSKDLIIPLEISSGDVNLHALCVCLLFLAYRCDFFLPYLRFKR